MLKKQKKRNIKRITLIAIDGQDQVIVQVPIKTSLNLNTHLILYCPLYITAETYYVPLSNYKCILKIVLDNNEIINIDLNSYPVNKFYVNFVTSKTQQRFEYNFDVFLKKNKGKLTIVFKIPHKKYTTFIPKKIYLIYCNSRDEKCLQENIKSKVELPYIKNKYGDIISNIDNKNSVKNKLFIIPKNKLNKYFLLISDTEDVNIHTTLIQVDLSTYKIK
jgi:hypothetical protein